MEALCKAIETLNGVGLLAGAIGVTQAAVSNWKSRGSVPPEQCPAIERACDGKVTVEQLRPDVAWHRVADKKWPHPKGRPLLDLAKAAA